MIEAELSVYNLNGDKFSTKANLVKTVYNGSNSIEIEQNEEIKKHLLRIKGSNAIDKVINMVYNQKLNEGECI